MSIYTRRENVMQLSHGEIIVNGELDKDDVQLACEWLQKYMTTEAALIANTPGEVRFTTAKIKGEVKRVRVWLP